jgi:hypothetical protein
VSEPVGFIELRRDETTHLLEILVRADVPHRKAGDALTCRVQIARRPSIKQLEERRIFVNFSPTVAVAETHPVGEYDRSIEKTWLSLTREQKEAMKAELNSLKVRVGVGRGGSAKRQTNR